MACDGWDASALATIRHLQQGTLTETSDEIMDGTCLKEEVAVSPTF